MVISDSSGDIFPEKIVMNTAYLRVTREDSTSKLME